MSSVLYITDGIACTSETSRLLQEWPFSELSDGHLAPKRSMLRPSLPSCLVTFCMPFSLAASTSMATPEHTATDRPLEKSRDIHFLPKTWV